MSRKDRYRLHVSALPGKPDIVFASKKKVIFVHGCFWHQHSGCRLARYQKSKQGYWIPKLKSNRQRDLKNVRELRRLGWNVAFIWECETRSPKLVSLVTTFSAGLRTCELF